MQVIFWSRIKFAAAVIAAITVVGVASPLTITNARGAEGEVPPAPVPMPGGGPRIVVVGTSQTASSGKASARDILRAAAKADLVAVVKVAKIEDHKVEKKANPAGGAALVRIGRIRGKQKQVSGGLVQVLHGRDSAKTVKFLVKVRGEGKTARAIFEQTRESGDPATGMRGSFTRATTVPFTLAADKKSLVFLKLEKEIKDEKGKVTERVYRLLPPLLDGAPKKTIAMVRAALKKLAEWDQTPKLTKAQTEKIDALITKLGDNDYQVREKATKDLIAEGAITRGKVREAMKSTDAETKARAEQVMKAIKPDGLKPKKSSTTTSTNPGGVTIIRGGGGGRVQVKIQMQAGP
jgi:hypothetical protein